MNNFDSLIANFQAILANPVFYAALGALVIILGVLRKLIDSGLLSGIQRLYLRLSHTKKKPLTTEVLKKRHELRADLLNRLNGNDHLEVIYSDAIRGGYTYSRNTKFLGIFRRFRYHRIYITRVFDDIFYASTSSLQYIKYSFLRGKWVRIPHGDEDTHAGYFSGKLRLDNVVYIDWDTDDSPTLYYNPPLFRMFDEEFFLEYKNGEYVPYDNRSWEDVGYFLDSWRNTIRFHYHSLRRTVFSLLKSIWKSIINRLRSLKK